MRTKKQRSCADRLEALRKELEKAREKASRAAAHVRELEVRLREAENLQIVGAVRSVAATPEELSTLLELIRSDMGGKENDAEDTKQAAAAADEEAEYEKL